MNLHVIMTEWKGERKKTVQRKRAIPHMPEGRYSKDKPNPNLRVFRGGAPARAVGSKKEVTAKTDSVSRRFVSYNILFCLCLGGLS
jgi:hypothetical protein